MKPTTLTHWLLPRTAVSAMVVCFVFSCMVARAVEAIKDEDQPGFIQTYQETWNESTGSLELEGIKAAAAKLKSASEGERGQALNWLRQHTGLEGRISIGVVTPKGASAEVLWQRYVTNLEKAISEKVPRILATRTWRSQFHAEEAARLLGEESPHPVFLPLLRQLCENNEESQRMRYFALTSITLIPHEGMIEFLIAQLDTDLGFRAWEQLDKLTRARIYDDKDDWRDVKQRYQKWWAENKDEYKYQRSRVLIER